jgi:uncharacterized protein YpmS
VNYWGFAFICLVVLAFVCMCLILWLDERIMEQEQEQEQERQEYLARLMSATGGIRSGENVTYLAEYRCRRASR